MTTNEAMKHYCHGVKDGYDTIREWLERIMDYDLKEIESYEHQLKIIVEFLNKRGQQLEEKIEYYGGAK